MLVKISQKHIQYHWRLYNNFLELRNRQFGRKLLIYYVFIYLLFTNFSLSSEFYFNLNRLNLY